MCSVMRWSRRWRCVAWNRRFGSRPRLVTCEHHPHVHAIATGGGLSQDGERWISSKPNFFLPVLRLSEVFRGKLLEAFELALKEGRLRTPESAGRLLLRRAAAQDFVVYSKPPMAELRHASAIPVAHPHDHDAAAQPDAATPPLAPPATISVSGANPLAYNPHTANIRGLVQLGCSRSRPTSLASSTISRSRLREQPCTFGRQ